MNKPLKDWTLGEIKAECEKHPGACSKNRDCPFVDDVGCVIVRAVEDVPYMWDLFEPPRWTEQDKEDAKALKRLLACASYVRRDGSANPKLYDEYGRFVSVLRLDCFAALPSETIVTLNEIIGGAE